MASLVQTISGNGGGYVNSYTISITETSGNLLTLCLGCGASDTPTISDTLGNTWTTDASILLTSQRQIFIFRVKNCAGGSNTITVQFGTGMYSDSAYILDEWSGINTSSPLDQTATANVSTGTSYTVGPTSATTQATELVIGAIACDSSTPSFTGDAGYNTITTQAGFDLYTSVSRQYKTVSSTGTQSWTVTNASSRQSSLALATYKQAVVINTNGFFAFF